MADKKITIIYTLKDKISSGMSKIRTSVAKTKDTFANFLPVLAATSAAFSAMIVDYAKLETKMVDVGNLFGATKEQISDLTDSLIELSTTIPLSTDDLANSLFDVVSAGIEAADSIKFLETASKLAVAGVTSTNVAVDGLTSVLNAYSLTADKAEDISDKFFAAQKVGKTTIEELSNSIGRLAPITKSAGISIDEMFASVSALTLAGISTEEAVVGVRTAITSIISPSSQAAKMAKELNIEFNSQALEAKGLKKFLEDVVTATDGNIEKMSILFGNIRGLNAALALSSGEFSKLEKALNSLSKAQGETAKAFEKQTDTISFQSKRIKNNILAITRSFANFYTPAIKTALKATNYLIEAFEKLIGVKQEKILGTDSSGKVPLEEDFGEDVPAKPKGSVGEITETMEFGEVSDTDKEATGTMEAGEISDTDETKTKKENQDELLQALQEKYQLELDAFNEFMLGKENIKKIHEELEQARQEEEEIRQKKKRKTELKELKKHAESKLKIEENLAENKTKLEKIVDKVKQNFTKTDEKRQQQHVENMKDFFMDIKDSEIKNMEDAKRAIGAAVKNAVIKQIDMYTEQAIVSALSMQPFIPVGLASAALAATMGAAAKTAVNSIAFAEGGIVPGVNRGQGDTVHTMLTPGEIVLNEEQQANLLNIANGETLDNFKSVTEEELPAQNIVILADDGTELAKAIYIRQQALQQTGEL